MAMGANARPSTSSATAWAGDMAVSALVWLAPNPCSITTNGSGLPGPWPGGHAMV